jgi:cyclopropane fatty-acyl-phospholipid synthase-like methyltransferase
VGGDVKQSQGAPMEQDFFTKFSLAWEGGYFEGNPLDPMASSTYGVYGYNSILYTVYLTCIRNYITPETTVLEIGPGRGAWTKTFLERGCKTVYAVDAAPAEHTGFWDYVGPTSRAKYIVSTDLMLSDVPDDSIDHFFSFGVFCHLKPEMCERYVASLAKKMRVGSHGFLMIADYDKYNYCLDHADQLSIKRFFTSRKVWIPAKLGYLVSWKLFPSRADLRRVSKTEDLDVSRDVNTTGWYHWGIDRACDALRREGLKIIDQDMEVVARDPVIHFTKP